MSHDFYPTQSPNVPEEAPGVPWNPSAGEIVVSSDDFYDDPAGPLPIEAEPYLPNTPATHALWEAVRDSNFGASQESINRVAPLMAAFMLEPRPTDTAPTSEQQDAAPMPPEHL